MGRVGLTRTAPIPAPRKVWTWGWALWGLMAPVGNALLGTIFLWCDAVWGKRFEQIPKSVRMPVLWCASAMWLSALFSPNKPIALATAFGFSSIWYLIGANYEFLKTKFFTSLACRLFVWSGVVASSAAIVGYLLFDTSRAYVGGLGFVGLGTTSIIVAMFGMGYLRDVGSRFVIPYVVIVTVGLVLTFTRGAWLGFAFAVVLYLLRSRKDWIALLVVATVFIGLVFATPSVRDYTVRRLQAGDNSRFGIWATVVEIIKENPLVGVGPGVHPVVYNDYLVEGAMPNAGHAHNMILGAFADMGIVGGVPMMWIMLIIAFSSLKLVIRAPKSADRGLGAGLIGVLIHQMFDIAIYGAQIGSLFWILGALACIRAEGLSHQEATEVATLGKAH